MPAQARWRQAANSRVSVPKIFDGGSLKLNFGDPKIRSRMSTRESTNCDDVM